MEESTKQTYFSCGKCGKLVKELNEVKIKNFLGVDKYKYWCDDCIKRHNDKRVRK
jgi:transcription elongation factor Elf1